MARVVWNKIMIMDKYYPDVEYTWSNELQSITWISENHPTDDEVTEKQTAENIKEQEKQVRKKRNGLLAETDWMANSDVSMSSSWKTYRQELRDLTNGLDTEDKVNKVTWPKEPS